MKNRLEFLNPFNVSIDFLETEEKYTSSFRCEFRSMFKHSSGKISYLANDIWIDFDTLDSFEKNLKLLCKGEDVTAKIFDHSNYLSYELNVKKVTFKVFESSGITSKANIEYNEDIDQEIIDVHLDNISNYAKWW